jgi:hypothetical protein
VGGLWQEREGRRSVKVRSPGVTGPNGAQRFLHLGLAQMSTSVVGQRQCPLHDEVLPPRLGSARTVLESDEAVSNSSDGIWTVVCTLLCLVAIGASVSRPERDVEGDGRYDESSLCSCTRACRAAHALDRDLTVTRPPNSSASRCSPILEARLASLR